MKKIVSGTTELAFWLLLLVTTSVHAQSSLTEHTLQSNDADTRPQATLADANWLVGSWAGDAFGGRFEEVWNAPSAGSMVGMFKLIEKGEVKFYELMLIVEEEGSLSLKVKHFTSEFTAWEDSEDYITFRLVGIGKDQLHFSGLSFYRRDDDSIDAFIAMRDDEQELREEELSFNRVHENR